MSRASLVLLHGWGMTPDIWDGLRAELPGHDILTPALPGHGNQASTGASLQSWSEAVLAQLPERCVLAGWSLGAMLALDIAARHPQRVQRLILIGASPRFVRSADWVAGLDASTVSVFTEGFAEDPSATLRRFSALQAVGGRERRQVLNVITHALANPTEAAGLADGLQILAESDLRTTARDVLAPTVLLHGREDALMPLAAAEWLAHALPRAQLQVFDECGHAPFITHAHACARTIEQALEAA